MSKAVQTAPASNFEMVRISHAKNEVGHSPNTIRKFHLDLGLPIYWVGRSAYFSRDELAQFIKMKSTNRPPKKKSARSR